MAVKGEVLFKSSEFGDLEGPRENKSSLIYEFSHEVYLPHESEENRIQGMRRIGPFEIVKSIDRLTPQLYNILAVGMLSEIHIKLYRIAEKFGEEEAYFNYILEEARIISIQNWMPPTYIPVSESIGHLEKIKIISRKITWEYIPDGIIYTETAF
jgi:type VI secretion system secreted protein Hcp